MGKFHSILFLALSIPSASYASTKVIADFIDNGDYKALKSHLYTEQPDALARISGASILDIAVHKKDKRAAIIIADYNNSTANERKLTAIDIRIENLMSKVSKNDTDQEAATAEIKSLQDQRKSLLDAQNIYLNQISQQNDTLADLSKRIKRLEGMTMPMEMKKATIHDREIFSNSISNENSSQPTK